MKIEIVCRDGVAYLDLSSADGELQEAVVNATSYKVKGADYRIRDNRRDKRTKLVRNGKCPVGLLDRVCQVLDVAGYEPVVVRADSPQEPKPVVELEVGGVTPRDYQLEAQMAAMVWDRGILRVPTGGGKSLIGTLIIAAKARYALIIVPTIDLLYQFKDYLTVHLAPLSVPDIAGDWQIGQLGDGVVDPQPVTVATIRTIAKVLDVAYEPYEFAECDDADDTQIDRQALREWVGELGTVLVDECQCLGAKTVYEVTTKIPAFYKYGMSASPWRDDGADLMIEAATGPVIFRVSPARLVQGGWLMAPHIRVYDTESWWESGAWGRTCARCGRQSLKWSEACECGGTEFRSQFTQAYREEIVLNEKRHIHIANIVAGLGRPTLVLVKQVRHGKALLEYLPKAVFLHGQDRGLYRREVFDGVRSGQVSTIICTTIADMGLDIPDLGALVTAGGGKSSVRHLQRIGRVVRSVPGKPQPLVVDLDDGHVSGWFKRHEQARRRIEKAEWGELATWERL